MYRQGDVFIRRVEELPADAQEVEGLVLARGEVTGHAHRLKPQKGLTRYERDEILDGVSTRIQYLVNATKKGVTLLHEEHGPVVIPPGIFRVRIQREYIPAGYRQVAD